MVRSVLGKLQFFTEFVVMFFIMAVCQLKEIFPSLVIIYELDGLYTNCNC